MRLFPQSSMERNRLGMRILAFCMVAANVTSLYARFAKYRRSGGGPWAWYYFDGWQVAALQIASFLALVMLGWSSVVWFAEPRFRDRRYGIFCVLLAFATLALWLIPAPAKIR